MSICYLSNSQQIAGYFVTYMPAIASALMGLLLFSGLAASAQAPTPAPKPGFLATLTAYNAVPGQTDSTPNVTANGGPANPEVVAARSQDLADELPFGTIIEIDGPAATSTTCGFNAVAPSIGYRVITDTMNVRYTDRVDVLFGTNDEFIQPSGKTINASNILGLCPGVTVRVVGHLDLAHQALPQTQEDLVELVKGVPLAVR